MRYAMFGVAAVLLIAAFAAGDGPGLMRSIVHGFGWGIGREVAHDVVRHALH